MVSILTGPGPSGNVVVFTVGYTEFLEDTFSSICTKNRHDGEVVMCLPLDPKFVCSNPDEVMDF
jgi:hypothetical protein